MQNFIIQMEERHLMTFWKNLKACSNTAKPKTVDTSSSEEIVNSGFEEETKCDWLIVMDNVSGLAWLMKKFCKLSNCCM